MPENRELEMFGCKAEVLDGFIKRVTSGGYRFPLSLLTMSILSDAQEVLARGNAEECRQLINRAKYIIDKAWNE